MFEYVKTAKAAGPDGLSAPGLKSCTLMSGLGDCRPVALTCVVAAFLLILTLHSSPIDPTDLLGRSERCLFSMCSNIWSAGMPFFDYSLYHNYDNRLGQN